MKKNKLIATARCHLTKKADNRVVAEGGDGYFNGTTGLPVGIHIERAFLSVLSVLRFKVFDFRPPTTDHWPLALWGP